MTSLAYGIAIFIVLFNFLCNCELAEYQPNAYAMIDKRGGKVQACGPILADILADLCGHIYSKGKRADHTSDSAPDSEDDYYYEQYPAEGLVGYPFRPKRSISTILRSSKRGISDQCCKHACTLDELKLYCGSYYI